MKKYTFFLVLFFLSVQLLYAQNPDPNYIKDTYRKGFMIHSKDSVYYQRLFFKAFPSNFKTFVKYYGRDKETNAAHPLTSVPYYYFKRFFNSSAYSRKELLKKIIGVSVNGRVYHGAIVAFQEDCFNFALAHNREFIDVLQTFSKPDIVSVWAFYFDYPNNHYRRSDYQKIKELTARNNKNMAALITRGYEKAVAKWAKRAKPSLR